MKNLFTSLKLKTILFFALLFCISSQVEASHFRYGTISWQITSYTPTTRTTQFNITQSWRWSAFGNPLLGTTIAISSFNFGDGTSAALSLTVTSINPAEDWFAGTTTLTKTYARTTDVTAFFSDCCRIGGLEGGNSGLSELMETVVTLSKPENHPPTANTPPIFYIQKDLASAQIQLNATDPDNDPLTFTVSSSAQSGLATTTPSIVTGLSSSGLLSLNTMGKLAGQKYSMQIMVADNQGARIPLDFIIQIVGTSNPPVFDYAVTPVDGSTIKVQPGTAINFTVKASDIDAGSTVSLNSLGIPVGAAVSAQSGTNPSQFTFSWVPTVANLGSYAISFTATDNFFVQTVTNVNIVVSLAPVFDVPPTPLTGVYNVVAPNQNLSFTVQATDPDPLDACSITEVNGKDNLNNKIPIYAGVTMTPTLPTAMANSTSSLFSWTPTQAQWGLKPTIFTAKDSYGDKTDHEITILVNTVPQFTSVPVPSVNATQNYQYNITSVDPDIPYGDVLELHSSAALPAWLTLTDNGDGTGSLSGTPGIADAGTYNISLQVEDLYHHTNPGGIPTQTFTIEVIPCLIEISGTTTDLTCPGSNNGIIDITLTGNYGTPTFSWTGPNGYTAATEDISDLADGSYTVVVSSDLGCTKTETFVVGTTPDETFPTAITQNITIQLDATGNASATADMVNNGSFDNCGIASVELSKTNFTCEQVGDNTVTLTVTDNSGNVSSKTAIIKVEDKIIPTWITVAGSLNRTISCSNAGSLTDAMALAPVATDNCSFNLTKTTGVQIGNTITNTWTATDASGNVSSVFTQVITFTSVTIDASGSSTPVALGSAATLYAKVTPAEAGIIVTFKLDQGTVAYGTYGTYTAITDASGIATKTVSGLTVEVYRVYAIAGDGCATSTAYLAVFDPNGSFVTGGGWITSPLGAYVADPSLTGKANFGFVSKYKKGSNIPDGNTEFQFQTGNLNFTSSSYSSGSLVIAGKQAIYKGIGTINGVNGYSFMVSAVDGQVSGGGNIDMFRMKIWNTSTGTIIYDNNLSSADNATPTTALGGGSIVIHASSTKSAAVEAENSILKNPLDGGFGLKVYPNPFTDRLIFEFARKSDTKATLTLFDAVGRKLAVLFDQQILENENYRVEYVPKDLTTNMLFYRMTFNDEVINGKMIYKK
jgi:hypothetical protein